MSLQLAAQHLASRGRGPDTTLVHMAPQEVAGLQALAKAHGGSLTVNPDTGLAEAGFLSSILPLAVGAFLGPAGFGLTAMQAGLAAGAVGTLATGSLSKGLMAGFGAYGGAGLAGGLMGAGAAGAAEAGVAGAGLNAAGSVAPEAIAANLGVPGAATGVNSQAALLAEQAKGFGPQGLSAIQNAAAIPGTSLVAPQNVVGSIANQVPTTTAMPQISAQGFTNQAAADATKKYMEGSVFDQLGGGVKEVMRDPKRFLTKENLQYGLAGLAPVAMDMMTPKRGDVQQRPVEATPRYAYDPGRIADPYSQRTGAYTGEVLHFDPRFTRVAAGGGLMGIGPIEAMSDRNQTETMMANGGMRFAEGGETKAVKPVEEDPYYTMSGQSGDAFKYLMGQMPAPSRAAAPAPAAVAPVQSTVQAAPAPVSNSPFQSGLFAKLSQSLPSLAQSEFNNQVAGNRGLQLFMGGAQPQDQGAGGYWADAPGNIKPYTFDPNTGTFTATPAPKVWVPYEAPATTTTPGYSYENMYGGMANGGIASLAQGGHSHLGDYSDGGRLLKGPGDGVSDSIPASIGDKRPARLADGEFVVPARIVSELGNGSTEAGARKLYAMMDRVQNARKKSIGKNRVAVNSRAEKLLPA
jgi:hypothetical protein